MQLDLAKINSFTFEPSTFCNLHCPQCPRYDTNGYLDKNLTQGHLSLDSMVKNFDLTKLPSLQNVIFEGDYGDPMMNPEIDQFVNFFKDILQI
jgi:MoaA/NifB/PqqE/SkfB family radical SAM enzyme